MSEIHVLRVFLGPDGGGGNPLELLVRPDPSAGTVDVGGGCRLEAVRAFAQ